MGNFYGDGAREITEEDGRNGLHDKPVVEDELGQSASSDAQNTLQQEFAHGPSTNPALPAIRETASIIAGKVLEFSHRGAMPLTTDATSVLNGSVAKTTSSTHRDSSDDPVLLPTSFEKNSAQGEETPISDPLDTKTKKRSRFLLDLPTSCVAEDMPESDYHNASPTKRARTAKTDDFGNQPEQDDTCDELSLSLSKQQPSHTTSKQSRAKRLRAKDELDDEKLGSDDIEIGLPVEKYQPRPSRSRSGRQDDELIVPMDFSKRPEAVAKGRKKNKRRKTTAFEQLLPAHEDEADIVQVKIPSPLKDPEKVRDIPAINRSEPKDQPQPEIDPSRDKSKAAAPKKRGRPRKQASEIHEGQEEKPACSEASPTKSSTAELNKPTSRKRKPPPNYDSDQSSADEDLPPPPSDMKPDIPNNPPTQSSSPPPPLQKS